MAAVCRKGDLHRYRLGGFYDRLKQPRHYQPRDQAKSSRIIPLLLNIILSPSIIQFFTNYHTMASRLVSWDRLVRYIPEGSSDVRYGDPIIPEGSTVLDIGDLANQGKLQVKVLEGADVFSASATGQTETVKKLLGPLEPRDVPIIRCIGLNYKTHSTWRPCPDILSVQTAYLSSSRNRASASQEPLHVHEARPRGGGLRRGHPHPRHRAAAVRLRG